MHIYDETHAPPGGEGTDITFQYEANFFVFATLEVARPMAHGRGQPQPPSQQVPVLTGMPVSGMAYLDRPAEAGYFIFPDLSVRHEGIYRLSFNLYEETKHSEDRDREGSPDNKAAVAGPAEASFDWRMEVKSHLFTVFSAKKFPGLAESTNLSRTVAEQGCRVRIRRDVRMRRREGKSNGDYDEEPAEEYRQGRVVEQDSYERERSRSNSGSPDRRPGTAYQDGHNQNFAPHSYSASPVSGPTAAPQGGYLAFGGAGTAAPAFAQGPPPPQAARPYQDNSAPYYPPGPPMHAANSGYRPPPGPPAGQYPYDRSVPQSANPSFPPREKREVFDGESRRASLASYPPQGPQYPTVDTGYNRPSFQGYVPRTQPALPPLQMIDAKPEPLLSPVGPLHAINRGIPPIHSTISERGEPGSYFNNCIEPQAHEASRETPRIGSKRRLDDGPTNERLINGMRPSSPQVNAEEDSDSEPIPLQYKRADGSRQDRELFMGIEAQ